jgi:ferredoxin/flavodoxin
MKIEKVWAVYFTGTGTTKKVVEAIADRAAQKLGAKKAVFDFSLPAAREGFPAVSPQDLVVFGTPVIAGRVPNVLLKYLATISGEGALAVPVVLYGNRNFDDALIELRDILAAQGFRPFAAGAFIGEHSFSTILGAGRPDAQDMALVLEFAGKLVEKVDALGDPAKAPLIEVPGRAAAERVYYQPRDRAGTAIDIRKVKPVTDTDTCLDCKHCASICTMQAIDYENVANITGVCIKCCACVKFCPVQAKSFTDESYLYHQHELEAQYAGTRREPNMWV